MFPKNLNILSPDKAVLDNYTTSDSVCQLHSRTQRKYFETFFEKLVTIYCNLQKNMLQYSHLNKTYTEVLL